MDRILSDEEIKKAIKNVESEIASISGLVLGIPLIACKAVAKAQDAKSVLINNKWWIEKIEKGYYDCDNFHCKFSCEELDGEDHYSCNFMETNCRWWQQLKKDCGL